MGWVSVKVVLDSRHAGETESLCRSLTDIGMTVETTMPEIGVIFGTVEESLLPKVAGTEGVLSAAPERTFRLPPPDGDEPR